MKTTARHKQSGVVLIFSLLIMLLVTLVGVNMVQQNRIQFLMAGNAQQASKNFALAEDILSLIEMAIKMRRYQTWPFVDPPSAYPDPNYTCNKTDGNPPRMDQIKPGDFTVNLGLSNEIKDLGVTAIIDSTSCLTNGFEVECKITNGQWDVNEINCNQVTPAFCPTEIYAITVTAFDENGNRKQISSKFAVRCDA